MTSRLIVTRARRRLVCLTGAALAATLAAAPALAQQSWLDKFFSSDKPAAAPARGRPCHGRPA
jgi:hypothetical protein